MSFRDWDILSDAPPFVGLGNYKELIGDDLWWMTLRQTIQYSVQTVFCVVALGLGAALVTFQRFKGQSLMRIVYYFPVTLSVAVTALAWQWLLNTDYGLINYVLSFVGIHKIRWLQEPALMLPSLTLASMGKISASRCSSF
jgi:multiple sugar transport system permease protein